MRLLSYKGFTITRKKDIWPLPSSYASVYTDSEVVSKKIGQLEGYYRDCARAGPGQEFQSS